MVERVSQLADYVLSWVNAIISRALSTSDIVRNIDLTLLPQSVTSPREVADPNAPPPLLVEWATGWQSGRLALLLLAKVPPPPPTWPLDVMWLVV